MTNTSFRGINHKNVSNTRYNSYQVLSKKERVLEVIKKSEIELSPREIAQKSRVNRSTVRVYLRQLLNEGKIVQPYSGTYCSKIIHGMMLAPLRVHNVIVGVEAPWLSFSDDVTEWVGEVKVRVQFGLQRRRITGRISCESGMDKNSVYFSLNRFYDIVRERTGHEVDTVSVKTFEVNRDVQGVRLDGFKCYTKEGLFGAIERIYQKGDVVRYENKITKPMTIDEFTALIRGGVDGYNVQQGLFMLIQEIRRLAETQKLINEQVLQLFRIDRAILERLDRIGTTGEKSSSQVKQKGGE